MVCQGLACYGLSTMSVLYVKGGETRWGDALFVRSRQRRHEGEVMFV